MPYLTGASSTTINGTGAPPGRRQHRAQESDHAVQPAAAALDKLADDASFNGINLPHGDTLKLTSTRTPALSASCRRTNGINSSVLGIGAADATEFSTMRR
jgi:hypothetical protein